MLITLPLTIRPDYLFKKKSLKTLLLHAKYIALNKTHKIAGLFAYSQCNCKFDI